jgi:hypothetical protein
MTTADLSTKSPAELIAIIQALAAASRTRLTMKVSEKGALSVYGFGQWPVTLYRSQWERLLEAAPEIEAFIKDHASVLTTKPAKT